MAGNRVVARYRDGRTVKGTTADFVPTRDAFHVHSEAGTTIVVRLADLKALFFVKDLTGNPGYQEVQEFEPGKPVPGRKIRVVFGDGELLVGTTQGYQPGRSGFFVVPADSQANHERCFVLTAATREVELL